MHLGHPRIITTFQNQKFLRIWDFQGFPYSRLCRFGLIIGINISKFFKITAKEWWKNKKHLEIFQKTFWTSPECILGILEPSQPSKHTFSQNLGFSGFPIHQIMPFLAHFLAQKFQNPCRKWSRSGEKI